MRLPDILTAYAAALALAAAGVATAQTPPPSPRKACRSSAMSLCRDEVKAGVRAGIRACLIRNFDKVTPECQAAMKYAQSHGGDTEDTAPAKP
jgi:hypothetical protein